MTIRSQSLIAAFCLASAIPAAAEGPRPLEFTIAVGGAPVAFASRQPGQSARLSLAAKRGQRFTLVIADLRMTPASASAVLATVRGPGDELVSRAPLRCVAGSECKADVEITRDGTHVIELESPFSAAASCTVSLAPIVAKVLSIDGAGIDFAAARPGDVTRFELDAPAGRAFTLGIDNLKHTPDVESNSSIGVFAPTGERVAAFGCMTHGFQGRPANPCRLAVPASNAPVHYEVRIMTPYGATVSGRLSATSVAPSK
ncbi:MAG TPA: hypothetical protein VMG61_14225 [Usitatibacter sp.]|nr:hypothetical protein [Usitatibacter sp.]